MNTHITEDIPRLLTGEATRDDVLAAAEHLRSCPDCQQELVSAVVAHASLTSAHRFAPEVVAPLGSDVRDEVARLLGHAQDGHGPAEAGPSLPPMTSMFEQVRQEAEVAAHRKQAQPRRRRLVALAAAAAIVVGGGVTVAELATASSSSTTQRTVVLGAFDRGTVPARATIVGDRNVRIDAGALKRLDSQHVYELWMTDGARRSMQSVGLLGNDNTASFTVSPKSLRQYDNFEVSIQRVNQTQYSGISVLRGAYST